MPSILEAWTRHKFNLQRATLIMESYLDPNRPAGTFPWDTPGLVAVPTLIGEPGVGKTQTVRQIARRLGLEYRDSQVGARAFEDVLGIPSREEDPDNPGHHKMLAPPSFPSEAPKKGTFLVFADGTEEPYKGKKKHREVVESGGKRGQVIEYSGYGVYFHDELMTADPDKQNQIRDMVENRRVGVLMMAEGWFQCAATNPPTRGFVTVKRMDRAVEDRLMYIPVQPEWHEAVGYWETNDMVPKVLVRYILWRHGEGFWGGEKDESKIGSRRWVLVGNIVQNMQRQGAGEDAIAEAISVNLSPEHAENFKRFMKFGEDQSKYPLRPNDMLDPEQFETNIKIMKKWRDKNKSALLSTSVLALRSWGYQAREAPDFTLEDARLTCLAKYLDTKILSLDQIQDLLTVFGSSSIGPELVMRMEASEEVMSKLSFATDVAEGKAELE